MKKNQAKKGFTLIEVLVALSLLLIIFGAVISLAILINESEKSSKNNLVAAYLAKEGLELVHYARDNNYIINNPAFTNIADENEDGSKISFIVDFNGLISKTDTSDVKQVEALKNDNGYYFYKGKNNSIFKRLVTTTYHKSSESSSAYIDVKVEVYWQEDTKQNIYTLESQLTDWR